MEFHVQVPTLYTPMMIQNTLCQSNRRTTGSIQFMNMVRLLNVDFVIVKTTHQASQVSIQLKKQIHSHTKIGRIEKATLLFCTIPNNLLPPLQPSCGARNDGYTIVETPL